jgi:ribonuclease HII
MNNISTIVGGDNKSLSIAAASIFAKVARDKLMDELDKDYPNYLWKQNKGYCTKQHMDAIKKFGITLHHRKSFLKKIII